MTTTTRRWRPSGRPTVVEEWHPRQNQVEAAQFLLGRQEGGLLADPGLGKTSVTLAVIYTLRDMGVLKGALIVAPKRVMDSVWPQELAQWAPFNTLSLGVLHGKHRERVATERHDVYLTNYESLQWLVDSGTLRAMFARKQLCTVVFDELSRLKKNSGKRFKAMAKWLGWFTRRYGLTGSPASNSLIDLHGQCYVLDLGRALGPYVSHYRVQFFLHVSDFKWVVAPGAEKLIYARVAPLLLRQDAADYVDMPKRLENPVFFELPPKARTAYDEMDDELMAMVDDDLITAGGVGAAMNKCRQICSGAIYTNPVDPVTGAPSKSKVWVPVHDAKLDALEELLEELQGQQAFVMYEFRHDLERIRERLPDVPYIGSGVSVKKAREYEDAWNAGEIPVLLGHPASVAHGLNLQKSHARHIIAYTLTWDYELYDQFIRRLQRSGSSASVVTVHQLLARDTVEHHVVRAALTRKRAGQEALFDALKEYRKSRGE